MNVLKTKRAFTLIELLVVIAIIALLQTIPGVGPRVSGMVAAIIDDPHRFKSTKHISSYARVSV
jgi:prepilin-type N-terminal cleavage/methylation domain-containing protein